MHVFHLLTTEKSPPIFREKYPDVGKNKSLCPAIEVTRWQVEDVIDNYCWGKCELTTAVYASPFNSSISNKLTIKPATGTARKIPSSPAILAPTNKAKNVTIGLTSTEFCITHGEIKLSWICWSIIDATKTLKASETSWVNKIKKTVPIPKVAPMPGTASIIPIIRDKTKVIST